MNKMEDSILVTIKKLLGLDCNYTAFDTDIVVFINTAMMTLQQLGVGPVEGFTVTGAGETWADFLPSDMMLEGTKTYIYLTVKMVFDPPTSSFVMDAMKQQKEELEWRLRDQAEFYPGDGSRKGYWQEQTEGSDDISGTSDLVFDSGFRARGGRYASDPDYPWADGPAQPAIIEPDGDQ